MCGILGIYKPDSDISQLMYFGLYALQHRGQESAGIAVSDGREIALKKDYGLVPEVFSPDKLASLKGGIGAGHVRYSTNGDRSFAAAQPLLGNYHGGKLVLCHNGNLTNAAELLAKLKKDGAVFQSSSDTEVLLNLIARAGADSLGESLKAALNGVKGAFSLVVMNEDSLIGVRDPLGFRPLCLGGFPGGGYALASESCAFDAIGAAFVREVEPGEIITISGDGIRRDRLPGAEPHFCIFEYVYFARPDSFLAGRSVQLARQRLGAELAREQPARADLVIPVPDSGTSAALGYAAESGIPFGEGMIKNRYVGRTFIQPKQRLRELSVRLKLNPIRHILAGKRIVVIDDSIVRGTTSARIIRVLREAGANEVHVRVSSPPVKWPCYFGIDTPTRNELIGAQRPVAEIREVIGADSLGYLSIAGMKRAVAEDGKYCLGCFDGKYPESPGRCLNVDL